MHTRISNIVEKTKLTKTDFAKRIGISQPFLSQLCSGQKLPSDRTISDICRVFNVNRRYLESGEEPMFLPALDEDTDYINELLANSSPFADLIRSILHAYVELPPPERERFDDFVRNLKNDSAKKDRD